MPYFEIKGINTYYENYTITLKNFKIKDKWGNDVNWVYISPRKLNDFLNGKKIKGNIISKRTRTWLE